MYSPSNNGDTLSTLSQGSYDDILLLSKRSNPIYRWQVVELLSPDAHGQIQMICTDVVDAWLELLIQCANSTGTDFRGPFHALPSHSSTTSWLRRQVGWLKHRRNSLLWNLVQGVFSRLTKFSSHLTCQSAGLRGIAP